MIIAQHIFCANLIVTGFRENNCKSFVIAIRGVRKVRKPPELPALNRYGKFYLKDLFLLGKYDFAFENVIKKTKENIFLSKNDFKNSGL